MCIRDRILQYLLSKTLLFALETPPRTPPKTVPSECKVAFRTPVGPFAWPSLAHFGLPNPCLDTPGPIDSACRPNFVFFPPPTPFSNRFLSKNNGFSPIFVPSAMARFCQNLARNPPFDERFRNRRQSIAEPSPRGTNVTNPTNPKIDENSPRTIQDTELLQPNNQLQRGGGDPPARGAFN